MAGPITDDVFGVKLQLLPISGLHSIVGYDQMNFWQKLWDWTKHLLCPLFVATFGGIAGFSRYLRNSLIEVLHADYITYARAKGLPERVVLYKHALRNALLPVITLLGLSLPGLIGGSVIFETIFGIPGLGATYVAGGYEQGLSCNYGKFTPCFLSNASWEFFS